MQTLNTHRALSYLLALVAAFLLGVNPSFAQVDVQLPQVSGDVGETITIPVEVSDVTGQDITSYQFTLPYDASILNITGVNVENAITPSQPTVNAEEGELNVSFAAAEAIDGSGVLLNLEADLVGAGNAPLSFSDFRFFDSDANEVSTSLTSGSVTTQGVSVGLPSVEGEAGASVTIPVEISDITGKDVTSYEFRITYDDSVVNITGANVDGAITPSDPTINTDVAGEVSVSFAAAEPFEGSGVLLNLEATLAGAGSTPLSFDQFQLFDSDANEVATVTTDGSVTSTGLEVSLPTLSADAGASVSIPVEVEDLTNKNITSYQFTLPYDASVLEITGANVDGAITPSDPTINTDVAGEVSVSFAAAEALEGSGTLLTLEGTLTGAGTTALSFSEFQLFDNESNEVATTLVPGSISSVGVPVTLGDFVGEVGESITIPIEIGDLSGKNVTAYEFTLPYDASVLEITGANVDGTITPSDPTVNTGTAGEIRVAFAASEALEGGGTLLNLEADLVGAGTSSLEFSQFQLFNNNSDEVASSPTTGSVEAQGIEVSLPEVGGDLGDTITIPVSVEDVTGEDITSYQFSLPYDASILNITGVNIDNAITPSEPTVNAQSGQINVSFAAAEALEGEGVLLNLEAELVGEGSAALSFSDFRFFDSNSNEVATTLIDGQVTVEGLLVSLPNQAAFLEQGSVELPVEVEDLTGAGVTSYQMTITFDESIVDITGVNVDETITPSAPTVNASGQGEIRISFAAAEALEGEGTLLNLEADLVAQGTSALTFTELRLFDDSANEVPTTPQNGQIQITPKARAQLIHNAADPAAETVDIYLGDQLLRDDVSFRSATAFLDVPANTQVDIGVAPASSSSVEDTLASFPVTFQEGQTYTAVVNGVVNPADFVANPGGAGIGLDLFLASGAQETGTSENAVDFRAVHGVTDAPAVDVRVLGGPTLIDDITYGQITPYLSADPATIIVAVAPGQAGSDPIELFRVDLGPLAGQAVTVLASGFLDPSSNQDGPGFTLISVRADGSVVELPTVEGPGPVTVNINQTFGDVLQQDNYRLVGLPGQVNLPLNNTVTGNTPDDWRAFWDNGATSEEQGLVEFDGSSTFNFQAGRGFWLISRNAWTVSETFDPVALNAEGNATIDLHDGWNIISNPFGKDVSWSAVQSVNGVSQALWQWNGSFSNASTFASAQNGEAFYFLNSDGLSELQIPFFTTGASAAVAQKKDSEQQVLDLTAYHDGDRASSVHLGLAQDASVAQDSYDQFAPPAYFQSTTLRVANEDVQSQYATGLATDYRPAASEGQRFNLTLNAEPGQTITLEANGLSQFNGQEVKLVQMSNQVTHNLHQSSTVTIRPESKTTNLVLLLGSSNFVDSQQSEIVPDKVKLLPNYPNPFQGQTTLRYALPEQKEVRLVIYDVLGRTVRTLVNEQKQSGVHSVRWDGRNNAGQPVASGLYLGRLKVGEVTQTTKLLLVK